MTLHKTCRSTSATRTRWILSGCIGPEETLQSFDIADFPYTLGRHHDCRLVLRSPLVSGRHAEFVLGGDVLFLRDLQSTNGTFLNGRRLAADSPVAGGDRIQVADCEFVIETAMPESRPQAALGTLRERRSIDRQWVFSRFDQLMNGGVFAAYQPIVRAGSAESYGVEALARSEVEELQRPDQMFAAARRVDREAALSKLCRRVALANCAGHVSDCQPLFLNTHPREDLFEDVLPSLAAMREQNSWQRMVIEIHEEAVSDVRLIQAFAAELESLSIEFAYDDFGAGQARLRELSDAPPHYIKFDRSLVQDVHKAHPAQRDLIQSLVRTARAVGSIPLAEGVESQEAADACVELGFELIQGFLYGRPSRLPRE